MIDKNALRYLHLPPDADLPELHLPPFIAIVLVEDEVSETWQWDACRWLVDAGCRYLLAWGKDCEAWNEAVDEAAQEAANYEDVAPERQVLTAAFEDEDMDEVFWFARHRAAHPGVPLNTTLVVHIAPSERKDEIQALYADA
jgi:hypothetical protein